MGRRDIAILGFTGDKREKPTGAVIPASFDADDDEENGIMRED
jgi:hypothetical protein